MNEIWSNLAKIIFVFLFLSVELIVLYRLIKKDSKAETTEENKKTDSTEQKDIAKKEKPSPDSGLAGSSIAEIKRKFFSGGKMAIYDYNFYFTPDLIKPDTIKIVMSYEDYGTGNRLGNIHNTYTLCFDKRMYTSVEDICSAILETVRYNQPYQLISDEEYNKEFLSLVERFKELYVEDGYFSYLK